MLKIDYAANSEIFQVCLAKSENGHYFCPLFTFPKKSWRKKYTKLYNKWIYLLKETCYIYGQNHSCNHIWLQNNTLSFKMEGLRIT